MATWSFIDWVMDKDIGNRLLGLHPLYFYPDDDCDGIYAISGDEIVTLEEMKELASRMMRFFAANSDEAIRDLNAERQRWLASMKRTPPPPRTNRNPSGYVYILQGENSLYKIGITRKIKDRLRDVGVKLPFETSLVHCIKSDDCYKLEEQLHQQYASKQVRGEWFRLEAEDLTAIRQISQGE